MLLIESEIFHLDSRKIVHLIRCFLIAFRPQITGFIRRQDAFLLQFIEQVVHGRIAPEFGS